MGSTRAPFGKQVRHLRLARGWTQQQLADRCGRHWTYIGGIERGERNITLDVIEDLARALDVPVPELFGSSGHPIEADFNASSWDILSAIQNGFRAQVDVKGKLAEYFLYQHLLEEKRAGRLSSIEWQDKDGVPDFLIGFRKKIVRAECKNVRSGQAVFVKPAAYKVELQRTRNSMDGTPTRGYRVDGFELLAACTFNQTGKWEYLFTASRFLARRPKLPDFLVVMQRVPHEPIGHWHGNIIDAINDCF